MDTRFAGRRVVVIGGSSGIGLAAAEAFVAEGARVAVTGRTEATLRQTAERLGVEAVHGDIANIASCRASVDGAAASLGWVDVLFVNAGVASVASIATLTPEAWDESLGINLRGCVFAIQAALPHMADGGAIVVTGSVGASEAMPNLIAYTAAKAGLRAAVRVLAAELLPRRIRVNMVSPGPTRTDLYTRGADRAKVMATEQRLTAQTPMQRMADAAEVAPAVLFLASGEAAFITGSDMAVDGGIRELGLR